VTTSKREGNWISKEEESFQKKLLISMVNNAVGVNLVKLFQVDVVWHSG
jgi:hypothetical protein